MTASNEVGRRARCPGARSAAALFALAAFASTAPLAALTERAKLPSGEAAALVDRKELYFEALPLRGEGLTAFCRRLTGSAVDCARIAEVNGRPRRLLAGVRYRVPYQVLTTDRKLAVVRALFPGDRAEPAGWLHRSRGEALAKTALWFTGSESNAGALGAANRLSAGAARAGTELRIPDAILLPIFRVSAPSPPPGSSPPRVPAEPEAPPSLPAPSPPATATSPLQFGEDESGRFAIYRLRGGEALYSAVVMRYTGRDLADDVNALAVEIAKRSGIADVTDIPIGHPIKVPLDLLLPEHLPAGDPRRLEWEVEQRLAEQFKNPVKAKGLEGVTVILDAGHGGADVGASRADVWESLYVYDVVLRVRRALGERTRAQVLATTRDGADFKLVEREKLPPSRGHAVMTTPPYPIGDATVGVHLRWYLANSLFRRHAKDGQSDRVVFLSIHADSLHPSLRGATVYIADAGATVNGYSRSGPTFSLRKEYREQPRVSFSLRERQKSEGRSHDLAQKVIAGFRDHTLAVHPFQPVRNRIFRGRRPWVPAVLRYNAVPAKMLLEICNLSNDEDRRLLQQSAFRETIAAAIVDGILRYFGESS